MAWKKKLEGSDSGPVKVKARPFLKGLKEQTKNPKSGELVSRLRFELSTFQIQFSGLTLLRTA
jgi:hypothetical protein